ncbi:RHS repeat-associated core domain-containing protein [Nocardiopsis alkaliphila]|uniref:RHS repeat-associated core domain-containing protein n=1 Tax=Nocardiopsis alkaliphila TaxID=225762 RepID=UPI001EFA04B2|nr:RHS repeat-associated core domain-containing protein [Nocardiopsis alkaliphila]
MTWDPAEGTEEATRYFSHAGETVAVRENDGSLHWIMSDHHGTGQIAIDADFSEVAQRRMTVFGRERGATGVWPGERGFVDGMIDASTGLTQLRARAYDADLGRFISVDPLMDLADSQQMHGYAYSNNNPVVFSDSDGLILCQGARGHDCAPVKNDEGKTTRHVYTGNRGFNSPSYAAGSAYGGGSRAIRSGWTRIPSWGGPVGGPGPWVSAPAPKPKPAPVLVNATVSPEDQALNNAKQNNDRSFWQRSGDWINDNWGTISAVGTGIGMAACMAASFGMCLAVGGAVVAAKFILDGYQSWATGRSMRWGEHAFGLVGVGVGGAYSGWLNGAMRHGMTGRGMRTHFSFRRVKDDFFDKSFNIRTNRNGSFDPAGTFYDGAANMSSVIIGNEISSRG